MQYKTKIDKTISPQTSSINSHCIDSLFFIQAHNTMKMTMHRRSFHHQPHCFTKTPCDLGVCGFPKKYHRPAPPPHTPRIRASQQAQAQESSTFSVAELPVDIAASWAECSSFLTSTFEFDAEEATKILVKAFGWGSQSYWRHERSSITPSLPQLTAVVEFLSSSVGITSPTDQAALLSKFPEVLGLEVELMQGNVDKLKTAFFLKGPALTATLKRKPRALGVVVDCEGTCQGLCTRCFAHF